MKTENKNKKIIVRFAPSPTGFLHLGSVRTALFNYLFARQNGGKFILRIEDTDKERSKKEYEEDIARGLKWLGFSSDEFYRQSEREDTYKKYLKKLVSDGKAYVSKESDSAETGKRAEVIRFKNPNKKISFSDMIRGEIEFDTTELKDFIIAKSIEEPLFHLAVVVDDFEMGITHVIRGEDHISNTPRQILIQEAIGAPNPFYAHIPLILDKDRAKLSKRKHGEKVSLSYYIKKGYLPAAMANYLSLLGWNPGTAQEIFTLDELIEAFSMEKIQKGGAIFSEEKMKWVNKEHLKLIPPDDIAGEIYKIMKNFYDTDMECVKKLSPIILDRISSFGDIADLIEARELEYFFKKPDYEANSLKWKGDSDIETTKTNLKYALSLLGDIPEGQFTVDNTKKALFGYAEQKGKGSVLWPLRFALSGRDKSPDPFTLMNILGKKETVERIKIALQKIQ
ncbi:MAG: glutamate--tRNA ligase [Patescibacteria group bacterium]|nr:glutamate--tRNA ligase [Patescibacteria group bacterium]MDE2218159.1 glutamate--tRNA ligase [Patescibacteria group bacterium]